MILGFLSALKEIVLTLTAITGAYVAVKGLTTWKRQINGQANYNLSKNLLISLFKYRDIISSIRNPWMSGTELKKSEDQDCEKMDEKQKRFNGTLKAYEARWKRLNEVRPEIYAHLIEAEALWGNDISKLWAAMLEKEQDLLIALQDYLEYHNPDIHYRDKEHLKSEHSSVRRIIFEGGKDDPFKVDFESRLDEMTKYIKTFIKN